MIIGGEDRMNFKIISFEKANKIQKVFDQEKSGDDFLMIAKRM